MKVTKRMSQNNQAMMLCCSTCCKPHSLHKPQSTHTVLNGQKFLRTIHANCACLQTSWPDRRTRQDSVAMSHTLSDVSSDPETTRRPHGRKETHLTALTEEGKEETCLCVTLVFRPSKSKSYKKRWTNAKLRQDKGISSLYSCYSHGCAKQDAPITKKVQV